jgi:hypothetical protein
MGMTRASFWRSAAVTLALAAMLLRGLLPAGWMPASPQSSGTLIVLCTHSGPVHIHRDIDGRPLKPSHNDGGRVETCPFGAAAHSATLAVPASIPGAIVVAAGPSLFARHEGAANQPRYSLHPPRAPPSLA